MRRMLSSLVVVVAIALGVVSLMPSKALAFFSTIFIYCDASENDSTNPFSYWTNKNVRIDIDWWDTSGVHHQNGATGWLTTDGTFGYYSASVTLSNPDTSKSFTAFSEVNDTTNWEIDYPNWTGTGTGFFPANGWDTSLQLETLHVIHR